MNTNPKTEREAIKSLKDIASGFDRQRKFPRRKKNEGIWSYLMRVSK